MSGARPAGPAPDGPRRRPRRRRAVTLGLLAVAGLAVAAAGCGAGGTPADGASAPQVDAGVGAPSAPPPSARPPVSTTTSTVTGRPARKVLLVGDSSMVDASPALTAMFAATGADVAMAAGPGFGLTRIGISDQDSTFRTDYPRLLREERPDLVVMSVGFWDMHFVEQHGVLAYARVVDEAARLLTARGAKLLILSMPTGGQFPERVPDGAFEAVAAMHPGTVFYLDHEGALRGPAGDHPVAYRAPDGSTVHLRKADGWHFCPDGAERIAAEVDRLGTIHGLTVPAPDGWQQGPWRRSVHYDDPACRS